MLTSEAHQIADRHFVAQEERPAEVEGIEIGAVEPFLRNLLFTDGTVTRALAVQTLASISVAQLDQSAVSTPAIVAEQLEVDEGEESIRRRVGIGFASAAPIICAESHLAPWRLPPGFLGLLNGAPQGIGQSLQRFALESYRELLWFGLTSAPAWAGLRRSGDLVLQRLYRIVSGQQVAILISESFAIEERAGTYRLAGLDTEQPPHVGGLR